MKRTLVVVLLALAAAGCARRHEIEPNDDFTRATPVRPNTTMMGTISSPSDADFYKLEVPNDSAVLSLHLGGIRDVDFLLSVQDKDRIELKRFDETGIGGDEEALDLGVHKGVYYIALTNKNPKANNPSQEYALQVRLGTSEGNE